MRHISEEHVYRWDSILRNLQSMHSTTDASIALCSVLELNCARCTSPLAILRGPDVNCMQRIPHASWLLTRWDTAILCSFFFTRSHQYL